MLANSAEESLHSLVDARKQDFRVIWFLCNHFWKCRFFHRCARAVEVTVEADRAFIESKCC